MNNPYSHSILLYDQSNHCCAQLNLHVIMIPNIIVALLPRRKPRYIQRFRKRSLRFLNGDPSMDFPGFGIAVGGLRRIAVEGLRGIPIESVDGIAVEGLYGVAVEDVCGVAVRSDRSTGAAGDGT